MRRVAHLLGTEPGFSFYLFPGVEMVRLRKTNTFIQEATLGMMPPMMGNHGGNQTSTNSF